ncbi:MAG: hypothetical protein IJ341_01985 [Bacteroidales bacterium]|nr:hypothetical protein [Bacteroidales bacterium]
MNDFNREQLFSNSDFHSQVSDVVDKIIDYSNDLDIDFNTPYITSEITSILDRFDIKPIYSDDNRAINEYDSLVEEVRALIINEYSDYLIGSVSVPDTLRETQEIERQQDQGPADTAVFPSIFSEENGIKKEAIIDMFFTHSENYQDLFENSNELRRVGNVSGANSIIYGELYRLSNEMRVDAGEEPLPDLTQEQIDSVLEDTRKYDSPLLEQTQAFERTGEEKEAYINSLLDDGNIVNEQNFFKQLDKHDDSSVAAFKANMIYALPADIRILGVFICDLKEAKTPADVSNAFAHLTVSLVNQEVSQTLKPIFALLDALDFKDGVNNPNSRTTLLKKDLEKSELNFEKCSPEQIFDALFGKFIKFENKQDLSSDVKQEMIDGFKSALDEYPNTNKAASEVKIMISDLEDRVDNGIDIPFDSEILIIDDSNDKADSNLQNVQEKSNDEITENSKVEKSNSEDLVSIDEVDDKIRVDGSSNDNIDTFDDNQNQDINNYNQDNIDSKGDNVTAKIDVSDNRMSLDSNSDISIVETKDFGNQENSEMEITDKNEIKIVMLSKDDKIFDQTNEFDFDAFGQDIKSNSISFEDIDKNKERDGVDLANKIKVPNSEQDDKVEKIIYASENLPDGISVQQGMESEEIKKCAYYREGSYEFATKYNDYLKDSDVSFVEYYDKDDHFLGATYRESNSFEENFRIEFDDQGKVILCEGQEKHEKDEYFSLVVNDPSCCTYDRDNKEISVSFIYHKDVEFRAITSVDAEYFNANKFERVGCSNEEKDNILDRLTVSGESLKDQVFVHTGSTHIDSLYEMPLSVEDDCFEKPSSISTFWGSVPGAGSEISEWIKIGHNFNDRTINDFSFVTTFEFYDHAKVLYLKDFNDLMEVACAFPPSGIDDLSSSDRNYAEIKVNWNEVWNAGIDAVIVDTRDKDGAVPLWDLEFSVAVKNVDVIEIVDSSKIDYYCDRNNIDIYDEVGNIAVIPHSELSFKCDLKVNDLRDFGAELYNEYKGIKYDEFTDKVNEYFKNMGLDISEYRKTIFNATGYISDGYVKEFEKYSTDKFERVDIDNIENQDNKIDIDNEEKKNEYDIVNIENSEFDTDNPALFTIEYLNTEDTENSQNIDSNSKLLDVIDGVDTADNDIDPDDTEAVEPEKQDNSKIDFDSDAKVEKVDVKNAVAAGGENSIDDDEIKESIFSDEYERNLEKSDDDLDVYKSEDYNILYDFIHEFRESGFDSDIPTLMSTISELCDATTPEEVGETLVTAIESYIYVGHNLDISEDGAESIISDKFSEILGNLIEYLGVDDTLGIMAGCEYVINNNDNIPEFMDILKGPLNDSFDDFVELASNNVLPSETLSTFDTEFDANDFANDVDTEMDNFVSDVFDTDDYNDVDVDEMPISDVEVPDYDNIDNIDGATADDNNGLVDTETLINNNNLDNFMDDFDNDVDNSHLETAVTTPEDNSDIGFDDLDDMGEDVEVAF